MSTKQLCDEYVGPTLDDGTSHDEDHRANARNSRNLERVAIDDLKPNPHYVRKPSRSLRRKLKASYRKFGENAPILVDGLMRILAGTQRVNALRDLGRTHVWVLVLDHLDEAQARGYAIADNRIPRDSDWDFERLPLELKEVGEFAEDFKLPDLGFDEPELDRLFQSLEDDQFDEDAEVEPADAAVPAIGDLWTLGPHRLLCADSLQASSYVRLMHGEQATATITDPPFNVPIHGHATGNGQRKHREFAMASGEMSREEFTAFLSTVFEAVKQHSSDGALAYCFMDFRHMREILNAGDAAAFEFLNLCVWRKSNAGMGSLYRSQHELCFLFKKGKAAHINNIELGRHGRNRSNVWTYGGANSFPSRGQRRLLDYHPTAKPVRMIADAILDCTHRGDIVLDPFVGSGTIVLAAERSGRRAYGIEIDPQYVDVSIRRWERMTGQQATNQEGQTFSEACRYREARP